MSISTWYLTVYIFSKIEFEYYKYLYVGKIVPKMSPHRVAYGDARKSPNRGLCGQTELLIMISTF